MAATSAEHVPANGAAGMEGENLKDLSPAHLVILAEAAIQEGSPDAALEYLRCYFKDSPPPNHFLARAHLCKAIISAPQNHSELEKLIECTGHISEAINLCKKSPPYHFMVFNASVLMWKLVRPFQIPGSRAHILSVITTASRALEEVGEEDEAWRVELLVALLHCQLEVKHMEDAVKTSSKALHLAKKAAPHRTAEIVRILVIHGLLDGKAARDEVRSSPQLYLLYKMMKLRSPSSAGSLSEGDAEGTLKKALDSVLTADARSSTSVGRRGRQTAAAVEITPDARSPCLVELAEVCLVHGQPGVARACMEHFTAEEQDSSVVLRAELVECQLQLEQTSSSVYSKAAVEIRLGVLKRLCQVMTSASRLALPQLVEQGGTLLWNASLPLLQHNLRHTLTTPLTQLTHYMEREESMLYLLRCEAHFELAKCLELAGKQNMAMEHINKAIALDKTGVYQLKLDEARHHLGLSIQLYSTPENTLDKVTALLEQLKTLPKGTSAAKYHHLLVEVGCQLAPGVFHKVLVTEREGAGTGEGGLEVTSAEFNAYLLELGSWSKRCLGGRERVEQHKECIGREEERERCRLWCKLARLARKHEAWGVSRAAAQLCLGVYNNGRWDMPGAAKIKMATLSNPSQASVAASLSSHSKQERGESTPQKTSTANLAQPSNGSLRGRGGSTTHLQGSSSGLKQKSQKSLKDTSSSSVTQPATEKEQPPKEKGKGCARDTPPTGDKEMLRVLSEAACLYGESLVYLLRSEGLKVFQVPRPPQAAKHVKEFNAETDENWKAYCEWMQTVSSEALSAFVQSAEVAAQLREGWMLHNAAVYMWNYSIHLVESGEAEPLVPYYRSLLRLMKHLASDRNPSLLCRVSTVFVKGVLACWTPRLLEALHRQTSASPGTGAGVGKKLDKSKAKGGVSLLAQCAGAEEELREALQVCEGALQASRPLPLPLPLKQPLLQSWVCLRQILQLPIDKALGQGQETTPTAHLHCVVVAIEMLQRQGGPLGDFSFYPTIKESMDHMTAAVCEDPASSLELWAALAELAWQRKDRQNAERCASEALKAGQLAVEDLQQGQIRAGQGGGGQLSLSQCHQLLSLVCSIRGGCMEDRAASDTATLKEAQQVLLTAARHGEAAPSYPHVIQACRMLWNVSSVARSTQKGRNSLVPLLLEVLDIVASLSSRRRRASGAAALTEPLQGGVVGAEEDLRLRVTMYCSVLQSYTDKMQWSEGLSLAEEAMQILPRTHHRELAQYRVLFKSRLSHSVEGDMVSFQEEGEGTVAAVWFSVAHNAEGTKEKMTAYKKAISTIKNASNGWQKVHYLLEFGEWLLSSQHPKATALAQFQDALHLVMCLESPTAETAPPTPVDQEEGEETEAPPPSPSPDVPLSSLNQRHLSEITDISHLIKIMSVFVMMAQVEGRGSPAHKDHLLTALDICVIIWKVFLSNHSEPAVAPSASRNRTSNGPLPSTLPKGETGHPTTAAAWATFCLSDAVRTAVRSGTEANSINHHTITSTGLTLHYLQMLVDGLHQYDLLAPQLPVLALELVIADDLDECRTWSTLVRMRIVAVCQQLCLTDAVDHHKDKMASPFHPDDIAKSEMDMAAHIAATEASSRELERWRSQRSTSKPSTLVPHPSSLQTKEGSPPQHGLAASSVGSEPCLQRVWLEEAGLMLDDGCYNTLHQMLQQALKLAQVFEDHVTSCDILLKLARLHMKEKLYDRAVELVLQAQSLPCTLESCLASYTLLLDVLSAAGRPVGEVIDHGVRVFEKVRMERPNERALVDHALSMLNYRRRLSYLLDTGFCGDAEWEELVGCVHQVEAEGLEGVAVRMMQECCGALKSISERRRGEHEDRLSLQCLFVRASRDLIQKQRALVSSTEQHSAVASLEGVSLPVVRDLAATQLALAEVLVDILMESVQQHQIFQVQSRDKPSIERIIEDYVREEPQLLDTEKVWHNIAKGAGQESLALLTSTHALTSAADRLAEVHLQIGRCLLAVANKQCPDAALRWSPRVYSTLHLLTDPAPPPEDGLGEDPTHVSAPPTAKVGSLQQHSTLSMVMRTKEAERDQASEVVGLQYLAQAAHSLAVAVNTGVEAHSINIVSQASLALVECLGLLDPSSSVQYLALHQSCQVAAELSSLLKQVHFSPQASRLAALIQHCTALQGDRPLPAYTKDCSPLGENQCVQNLLISQDHLSLVRGFPANFRFIILQHSPNREKLYAGYMFPPQPPPPTAGKKASPSPKVHESLQPVVSCVSVSAATLDGILELMSLCKKELDEGLEEKEAGLGREGKKRKLFEQPNSQCQRTEPPVCCPGHTTSAGSILSDVLAAMEAYLSEGLDLVTQAVRREQPEKALSFVLLVDSSLAQLPLEALPVFSSETVHTVTRDFSLQMLCNRLKKFTVDDDNVQTSKTPAAKKDKDKFKPQTDCFLANCATAKYVVDVGKKICSYQQEVFRHLPDKVMAELGAHSKMTAKWTGMTKTDHLPKPSELRSLLSTATGLVYLGERGLLDLVEPSNISLGDCPFALLMTVAPATHCSSAPGLSKSLPVMEAQLLSLCGVSAVLQNQWTLDPTRAMQVFRELVKGMLAEGKTVSSSYWDALKAPPPAEQHTEGEQGEVVMQGGKQVLQQEKEVVQGDEEVKQQDHPSPADGPDLDPALKYNFVLYGLPHVTFTTPS